MAEGWKMQTESNNSNDAVPGRGRQIMCQPCSSKDKQTPADIFCSTCDEFQCAECSNGHNIYGFMKNHKLINAKDLKSKPTSFDMKGLDQCDQHQELLKFYCEDDRQLCCSTCAIVDHRKCHSVLEIQKIAGKSSRTSSELLIKLQEVKARADTAVKHTQSTKEQLDNDTEEIPLKIKRMRESVIKMFDDLEVSVSMKTTTFKTETTKKLEDKQKTCEKHVVEVTKSQEKIDDVYQNGTPSQQFIVEHKLKDLVKELQTKVEETCLNLETVTVSFGFDEKLKLPPRTITEYIPGQLTLKHNISDSVKSIAHGDPILKLKKITSIHLKQTGDDVGEPLYTGLDFLPDDRLVAVDNRNMKCLIFNEKLEKLGSYQLSYPPQSVTVVSEEEVAITSCRYKIECLSVSKSKTITSIRISSVKTKYDSICMKDDGNFLVGTVDDTRPVRIVSLSGEEKDLSIELSKKTYPLRASACTYIRNSHKVVLTDREEHTVHIYDIATNTRVVVRDDQINEPRGIAVGPLDCILVCSKGTDSIVQISQTGRILSCHKLDAKYPFKVCVSQNETVLAVSTSCAENVKLQLFKITH